MYELTKAQHLIELEEEMMHIRQELLRYIRKHKGKITTSWVADKASRGYLRDLNNYAIRDTIKDIGENL